MFHAVAKVALGEYVRKYGYSGCNNHLLKPDHDGIEHIKSIEDVDLLH